MDLILESTREPGHSNCSASRRQRAVIITKPSSTVSRGFRERTAPMLSHCPWKHRGFLLLGFFLFVAAIPASLEAQQATVAGRVVDPSGAAIPGATVAATNIETGIRTAVTTNTEGH